MENEHRLPAKKPMDTFAPIHEIVIFHAAGPAKFHAQISDLHVIDGKTTRGGFRPLSEDAIRHILLAFQSMGTCRSGGVLPENVISTSPTGGVAWWLPAATRALCLTKDLEKSTGLKSGPYNWPPLLFLLSQSKATIYVLPSSERPGNDTPLFIPPFWNVQPSGDICFGSARYNTDSSIQDNMKSIETAFFDSYFSHIYGGGNRFSDESKLTLNSAWAQSKETPFPTEALRPFNMTVGDLLSKSNF